jgi:hypothetical protein
VPEHLVTLDIPGKQETAIPRDVLNGQVSGLPAQQLRLPVEPNPEQCAPASHSGLARSKEKAVRSRRPRKANDAIEVFRQNFAPSRKPETDNVTGIVVLNRVFQESNPITGRG